MSTWRANKLAVMAAWVVGFIGPILNGDAATFTTWSVFAIAVAGTLTLLERLDALTKTLIESPASASERLASTSQIYGRA